MLPVRRLATLLLVLLALPLAAQIPTDPVAWLKAEGNAQDASGNANHGTVNGSVPYVTGKVGNAFSFSGVGANTVRIPNSASLQSSLMSVEYWVYFNNAHNPVTVTKRSVSGAGDAWQAGIVYVAPNFQLQFVGNTAGGLAAWYSAPISSPVGVWTHVATTYDGTTVRGYINGSQVLTQTVALQMGTQNADVYLGAHPGGANAFNGNLDEVSLYNRALSAAEVLSIYQAGPAGKTQVPTVTGISPNSGPAAGGTSVTITGTNFTGATGVTIGGAPATAVSVVNGTTITATTPAGAAGTASVVVTTPGGSNAANSLFTYGLPNTAPSFNLPSGFSQPLVARESNRTWVSLTSSADGSKLAAVVGNGQIHTSTDSGVTWTPRETNRNWRSIVSSADGSKLAAVVGSGQIHTSTDGGVTWTPRETNRNWISITSSADGSKLAAVVGSGQIHTSTDGGVTWTPRETNRFWRAIVSSADGSKLAAVVFNGQIHTSTDGGATWTARSTKHNWVSIASSADGSKLAAVEYGGQIYTSTDSGITWTARESNRSWQCIASSADGSKMVAAVQGGQIHISTDGGVSWSLREIIGDLQPITISADGNWLAAAVVGGRIYTTGVYNLELIAGPGMSTTAGFATDISPGPLQDAGQSVDFLVSNNNNALFTVQPAISGDGTLTFTPSHVAGVATVTVSAHDNGGTVYGGADTSAPKTFIITIHVTPSVTAVEPDSGLTLGGTSVTITGADFINVASVTFGGTAAAAFSVVNPTTITATTPAHTAGPVSVHVTTAGGSNPANSLFTYVAPPPPVVSGLSPDSGPTSGGTLVTITGANFTAATGVTIGGTAATGVTVVDATTITATTPAGPVGTASVVVTTPGGSNAANALFTYINAAPSFNLPSGFTQALVARDSNRNWRSITSSADGTKLAAVEYGGRIYTSVDRGVSWTPQETNRVWNSIASSADGSKLAATVRNGQIHTSVDSGATWTARENNRYWSAIASSADGVKLAAVEDGGQIYTSADSGVTWTPRENNRYWLSITSSADGTKLAAVEYGGRIYTSANSGVSWTPRENSRDWESITSSADGRILAAVVSGGQSQIYTSYNYGVSWTPRGGSDRQWFSITSSADGGRLAAVVDGGQVHTSADAGISWSPREAFRNWSAIACSADGTKLAAAEYGGRIYTTAPYNLTILGNSGSSTTANFASGISPGPAAESGQTVSFDVSNSNHSLFAVQPAISIDGTLTFTPGNTAGVATVTVVAHDNGGTALGGVDTSSAQTFTITVLHPPTVSGISPSTGPTAGGTSVTLTGTNFIGVTSVTFGGVAATGVTVVNETTITAVTPAGAAGTASVVVTTESGSNAANSLYTYVALPPTVTWVSPSSGVSSGGTRVTIMGTNFTADAVVTFGGAVATNVTVSSPTTLTATAPPGVEGAASVVVTTPGGSNAANTLYTYVAVPTDMVAWLKAEGNATDATTFANHGQINGSVPVATGKVGDAFSFDGTGAGSVSIVNSPSLQSELLTVEYWVYFNTAHNPVSVAKRSVSGAGDAWQVGIVYSDGNFLLQVVGNTAGGLAGWYSGNLDSPVGVWTHVAATYDGTTVKCYINGTEVLSVAAYLQLQTQNADIYLGKHPADINCLNGKLDEVSIYNYALSASRIQAIYQAGAAGKSPGPTVTAVTPSGGPAAGGTAVTITGTNFSDVTGVTIGGTAATGVSVVNSTTITVITPAHAAGAASVVVTTLTGSNVANTLYTYMSSPIESWRQTHFGISGDTGDAADGSDLDRDGLNNLAEYGLVLDPKGFSPGPSVERFAYPEGERLRMILQRDPDRADVTIEVQASGDLTNWTAVATSVSGAPFSGPGYVGGDGAAPGVKSVEIRDTLNIGGQSHRFLRVTVTR